MGGRLSPEYSIYRGEVDYEISRLENDWLNDGRPVTADTRIELERNIDQEIDRLNIEWAEYFRMAVRRRKSGKHAVLPSWIEQKIESSMDLVLSDEEQMKKENEQLDELKKKMK